MIPFPPEWGYFDLIITAKIAGRKPLILFNPIGVSAVIKNFPSQPACLGTYIDDLIRCPDDLLFMLNHNHGIANVSEILQHFHQLSRITRMQTYAGFIENVQ